MSTEQLISVLVLTQRGGSISKADAERISPAEALHRLSLLVNVIGADRPHITKTQCLDRGVYINVQSCPSKNSSVVTTLFTGTADSMENLLTLLKANGF